MLYLSGTHWCRWELEKSPEFPCFYNYCPDLAISGVPIVFAPPLIVFAPPLLGHILSGEIIRPAAKRRAENFGVLRYIYRVIRLKPVLSGLFTPPPC